MLTLSKSSNQPWIRNDESSCLPGCAVDPKGQWMSMLGPGLETSEGWVSLQLQSRPGKLLLCLSLRTGKEITKTRPLVYGLETPIVQLCSHLQAFKQPAAQPRPGLYCVPINHKSSIIDIKTDLSTLWKACVQSRLLTHLWVNFISPLMQNSIFIWILNISGYPIDITCLFKYWFLSHLEAHFRSTLWLHTYISTIPVRKWIPHVRMESYSCVFHHLRPSSGLRDKDSPTFSIFKIFNLDPLHKQCPGRNSQCVCPTWGWAWKNQLIKSS